ncbi:MAG: DUF1211 domain-containing protein [Actinomycetia bacterium]|nr:DUF1211 domain-containing protein [Actinomycetes bacterium]
MNFDAQFMPTNRLEAFSDGVYAIAITLLVLELDIHEAPGRLLEGLAGAWPSFLAYLVSFAFIGGSWLAHTKLTRLLTAADNILLGLNLLLLLFVAFLPFTTAVLGEHLNGSGQRVAVIVFGANLTLATALGAVLCSYVVREENLVSDGAQPELRKLTLHRWSWAALWAASTIVGAFWPVVALFLYVITSVGGLILLEPLQLLRHRRNRLASR